jgi:hypothetical protein
MPQQSPFWGLFFDISYKTFLTNLKKNPNF